MTKNRYGIWVFAALAALILGLAATTASGRAILGARWSLFWLLAAWAACWLAAVAVVFTLPRRLAVPAVLAVAMALRMAALAGPPTTSDDLYRYAWDGRAQAAGIDPYADPPDALAVSQLRESWLWPDEAECARLHRPAGCTRINRPAVRTIYPPVAEAWFAAVYRTTGVAGRHKTWQAAGLVADLAIIGGLLIALRRWGRDPRWIALYALSPAPVLEFVTNGHVDAVAVALVVAALAVAAGPATAGAQEVRRDIVFGLLVGAAALVKIYPGVLLFAACGMPVAKPVRSWLRATSAAAVLAALCYLPHVLTSGVRVIGYLPGYLREEHYDQGGRFLLAGLIGLSGWPAGVAAVIAMAAAIAWVVIRRPPVPVAAAVLLVATVLIATPVQPWYAVALVAAATLVPWPAAVGVGLAGYPYFFAVILDDPHAAGVGRACFAIAAVAAIVAGPGRRSTPGYEAVSSAMSMERQQ